MMLSPWLIGKGVVSKDAEERAKFYLSHINHNAFGAYTSESPGYRYIKKEVGDFISQRDGIPRSEVIDDNIYLTNGASEGVSLMLKTLIRNPKDGIMIPIPQYPLYTAEIAMNNAGQLWYYMNEDEGWSLDMNDLKDSVVRNHDRGVDPRAIVVINPGNPTGNVLTKGNIKEII